MKLITRTIISTEIHASKVRFENGGVVTEDLEPITVFNKNIQKEEDQLRVVKQKYGKNSQYVIRQVNLLEKTYGMPVAKFLENAVEVVNGKIASGETVETDNGETETAEEQVQEQPEKKKGKN